MLVLTIALLTTTTTTTATAHTDNANNTDGRHVTSTGPECVPTFQNNNTNDEGRPKRPGHFGRSADLPLGGGEVQRALEKREVEDAAEFGLRALQELLEVKEPKWFGMGLILEESHPAKRVADLGRPNRRSAELAKLGIAALEASKRIAEKHPGAGGRGSKLIAESRLLADECPLKGAPACPPASRRFRTADGTCNNPEHPWRGASTLPLQRFLPPAYSDGIQAIRRSAFDGSPLPSARDVSVRVHRDRNVEQPAVNLMLMQWGQFLDHDITFTVKSRSFNGSIPRCCNLPQDLTHPSCLPIPVSDNDWFYSKFGITCLEFVRSAPSTRIDCHLGWKEQINQVTSFIDASTVYGSNVETAESLRTFRGGKLQYGRAGGGGPLHPPDPPHGELCRTGAIAIDCFPGGDGRLHEQIGLTAMHTIFLRYHNKVATLLGHLNPHWSDEKVYQETRRIVGALVQHITFREFLPVVLGREVMQLFELNLEKDGHYKGYDARVNPAVANAFSAAAFRFGHSLVQKSFVRADPLHRPLFNNVSLHEELNNLENIWSFGSLDRLVLGMCNQPTQRRDQFVTAELTNHLFQSPNFPFGIDLVATNIQRGRDHGLPSYTSWRTPCGLSPLKTWSDLLKVMSSETVQDLRFLYKHVDDIDLFTGGLAEKSVRGGLVGPTFACIIAQQFTNLRKGDRFWYENGGFESSFTPAQLEQIRHMSLAQILCHTLTDIETIQPFVFLPSDAFQNNRLDCRDALISNFDLSAWIETDHNELDSDFGVFQRRFKRATTTAKTKSKIKVTTPLPIRLTNRPSRLSSRFYNFNRDTSTTDRPLTPIEVNIKIQYFLPTTTTTPKPTTTTKRPKKKKRPTYELDDDSDETVIIAAKPSTTTQRPNQDYPIFVQSGFNTFSVNSKPYIGYDDEHPIVRPISRPPLDSYGNDFLFHRRPTQKPTIFEDEPFSTSKRPYVYKPHPNHYIYTELYGTKRPSYRPPVADTTKYPSYLYTFNNPQISSGYNRGGGDSFDDNDGDDLPKKPTFGQIYDKLPTTDGIHDKLDFQTRLHANLKQAEPTQFVKISSVTAKIDTTKKENWDEERETLKNVHSPKKVRRWLIFDATATNHDATLPLLPVPEFCGPCAAELPKPMNLTDNQ